MEHSAKVIYPSSFSRGISCLFKWIDDEKCIKLVVGVDNKSTSWKEPDCSSRRTTSIVKHLCLDSGQYRYIKREYLLTRPRVRIQCVGVHSGDVT